MSKNIKRIEARFRSLGLDKFSDKKNSEKKKKKRKRRSKPPPRTPRKQPRRAAKSNTATQSPARKRIKNSSR